MNNEMLKRIIEEEIDSERVEQAVREAIRERIDYEALAEAFLDTIEASVQETAYFVLLDGLAEGWLAP